MDADMKRSSARRAVYWASGVNALAGVWLIAAPFALGYAGLGRALWNDIIIGIAVLGLAMTRTAAPLSSKSIGWINTVLGVWLIIAPFALGYSEYGGIGEGTASSQAGINWRGATGNDIIIGILVICLSAWSSLAARNKPREV